MFDSKQLKEPNSMGFWGHVKQWVKGLTLVATSAFGYRIVGAGLQTGKSFEKISSDPSSGQLLLQSSEVKPFEHATDISLTGPSQSFSSLGLHLDLVVDPKASPLGLTPMEDEKIEYRYQGQSIDSSVEKEDAKDDEDEIIELREQDRIYPPKSAVAKTFSCAAGLLSGALGTALTGNPLFLSLGAVSCLPEVVAEEKVWGFLKRASGGENIDIIDTFNRVSDGGYIAIGSTKNSGVGTEYDLLLMKYSSDFELLWAKTLGGNAVDVGADVKETSDGGYIVTGRTTSFGAGNEDILLAKYTADGTLSWAKVFGTSRRESGDSIQQTADGGYIMTGYVERSDGNSREVLLAKFTGDGSLSWVKSLGAGSINYSDLGFIVQIADDGGYVVLADVDGSMYPGGSMQDVWLMKLTSAGSCIWAKAFGGAQHDRGWAMQKTSDGCYIIAGKTESFGVGSRDVMLSKFDDNGNRIWTTVLGGSNQEEGYAVQETSDGGYIVTGYTYSFGFGNTEILLIKYASDGNLVWAKTLGGSNYDGANEVIETEDGGYLVMGGTTSYGNGVYYDVLLAKFDSAGNIYSCHQNQVIQDITELVSFSYITPTVIDRTPTISSPSLTMATPAMVETTLAFTVSTICPNPPTIKKSLADQEIYSGEEFSLPINATEIFQDSDGDDLTLTAKLTSGETLPAWLEFESTFANETALFTGTPTPADRGSLEIALTADDGHGGTASDTFHLTVQNRVPQKNILFIKRLSGIGYAVEKTFDGGFIAAGSSLVKFNSAGEIEWGKSLNGQVAYSVKQTSDGGYIASGVTAGGFIVKFNSAGSLVWAKQLSNASNGFGRSVDQTEDGGYILTGGTTLGAGNDDIILAHFNSDGSLNWAKAIGGVAEDRSRFVQQTTDGGYFITGWTFNFGAGYIDIILAKFDSDGSLDWAKTIGGGGDDRGISGKQTSDDGYIIIGYENNSNLILSKFNGAGSLTWSKSIRCYDGYTCHGLMVQQTSDSGYIVTGVAHKAGSESVFLGKFSSDGSLDWAKAIDDGNTVLGAAVEQSNENEYIVTHYDGFIAKLNEKGELNSDSSPVQIQTIYPTVTTITPTVNEVTPTVTTITPTVSDITSSFSISDISPEALATLAESPVVLKNQTTSAGTAFSYEIPKDFFIDLDGDDLTLTAKLTSGETLPAWLEFVSTFANETAWFTGTPTPADRGSLEIALTADDGHGGTASDTFQLTVQNRAPQKNILFIKRLNGIGYAVEKTFDGGFIAAGTGLVKFDALGKLVWGKEIGRLIYSVQQTSDGGYIVSGQDAGGFIAKFSAEGNLSWAKTLSGATHDFGRSVYQTSDGGYVLTGGTTFGAGDDDIILAKFSAEGDLTWAKTIGESAEDRGRFVQQTDDGGYIIVGWTFNYGTTSGAIFLAKCTSDGSLNWAKTIDGAGDDRGLGGQQTSDGGYIITGYTYLGEASGSNVILVKLNSDGNLAWAKAIGCSERDDGWAVKQTRDGGYIVTGVTYDAGTERIFLGKFNSAGSLVWAKALKNKSLTWGYPIWGYSVEQTSDDGYIVTGADRFIAKFSSAGELNADSTEVQIETIVPTVTTVTPTINDVSPIVTAISPSVSDLTSSFLIQDISPTALETITEGSLTNQTILAGKSLAYEIPKDFFIDFDKDDLTLTAKLTSGETLPAWLEFVSTFANETAWFTGTPTPADRGSLEIALTADDGHGGTASDTFQLTVQNRAPLLKSTFFKTLSGYSSTGYSVHQMQNGKFILTGYFGFWAGDSALLVAKFELDGSFIWCKAIGNAGNGYESGNSVYETSDGGYIITGQTNAFGAGNYDVLLAKFASSDDLVWAKVVGGDAEDYGYSVQQTSDGGFIIAGETASCSAGSSDLLIAKFDSEGNLIWNRAIGGADYDYGVAVQQMSDDGFIVAGYTKSFDWNVLLAKFDIDGNLLWSKTIGGNGNHKAFSMQKTDDDCLIITGHVPYNFEAGNGGGTLWIGKFDSNGELIWSKSLGESDWDEGCSVQQTKDGGFIVVGETKNFGAGYYDIFLAKFAGDGSFVWSKTIGGLNYEYGASVEETSDGGYIITGLTRNFGSEAKKLFLAKVNSHGEFNSGSAILQDVTPTFQTITPIIESIAPTVNTTMLSFTDITADLVIQDIPESSFNTVEGVGLKNQTIDIDKPFSHQISDELFYDPDGDALTLSAKLSDGSELPDWLSFNETTRTFTGTPGVSDRGKLTITLTADDGHGGTITEPFTIIVEAYLLLNKPILDQAAAIEEPYYLLIPKDTFMHEDGEPLTYEITLENGDPLPDWLHQDLTEQGIVLTGIPLAADEGLMSLKVTASYNEFSNAEIFNLRTSARPSGEFRVNTYTLSDQTRAAVAVLANGEYIIVWESTDQDGNGTGIFGKRYSASGLPISVEFQINTSTVGDQKSPAIVANLEDDQFVIVWQGIDQDSSGIYGQRFKLNGDKIGNEFLINTHTTSFQGAPAVSGLNDGGFVVVWNSNGQDGSSSGIYGQKYYSDGTPHSTEFQINTCTYAAQSSPSVDLLQDGKWIVTWWSDYQDGSLYGIFGQLFNADGTPSGSEFQINTYTNDYQTEPVVASLSNGGFVISWSSNGQDGSNYGVYGQIFKADGSKEGSEFQISSYTQGRQSTSSMIDIGNGKFIVTWRSQEQDGSSYGIFAQILDYTGNKIGREFQVNDYTLAAQSYSSVARLEDGKIIITWQSENQDGGGYGIYSKLINTNHFYPKTGFCHQVVAKEDGFDQIFFDEKRFTGIAQLIEGEEGKYYIAFEGQLYFLEKNGNDLIITTTEPGDSITIKNFSTGNFGISLADEEFQVNTYTNAAQTNPAITRLQNGDLVIVWQSDGQDGSDLGIYGQRFTPSGEKTGAEFQVNTYTLSKQYVPAVIHLKNGGFLVSWMGRTQDSDNEVFAQFFDSDGNKSGSEFQVNTYFASYQSYPDITELANGDIIFVWHSGGQDGSDGGVFAQRYAQDGLPLGSEFQVNHYTVAHQLYPQISSMENGNFIVTWESLDQDGQGYGIYAKVYTLDGSVLKDEFQINTYTNSDQQYPSVVGLKNGNFVVTWESNGQDGQGQGIYAKIYTPDGSELKEEFQVNTYTAADQSLPHVAGLEDGTFIISWQSNYQDGSGSGIYAQRFDYQGNPIGEEFSINSYAAGDQRLSRIVSLENGKFVATWDSDDQDGSSKGIYGKILSASKTYFYDSKDFGIQTIESFSASDKIYFDDVELTGLAQPFINDPNLYFLEVGEKIFFLEKSGDDLIITLEENATNSITIKNFQTGQFGISLSDEKFQLNVVTNGRQMQPELTKISDDRFVGIWQSGWEDKGYLIKAQLFTAAGIKVGDELQISSKEDFNAEAVSPALLSNGNLVFVWVENEGGTTNYKGKGQIYSAEGEKIGSEFTYGDNGNLFYWGNHVISLKDGRFVTFWTAPDVSGAGTYFKIFNSDGTPDSAEILSNQSTTSYQIASMGAQLANGNIFIVWMAWDNNPAYGVVGRVFSDQGVPISDEIVIATGYSVQYPLVTALPNGHVIVTYGRYTADTDFDYYGQIFTEEGVAVGDAFCIHTHLSGIQEYGSVEVIANNKILITWSDVSGTDGYAPGMYGQLFDFLGNKLGDEFYITPCSTYVQDTNAIAAIDDASFMAIWHDDGSDYHYADVYAKRYSFVKNYSFSSDDINTVISSDLFASGSRIFIDGKPFEGVAYPIENMPGKYFIIHQKKIFLLERNSANLEISTLENPEGKLILQNYKLGQFGIGLVGEEFQVNSYTAGDQSRPQVAILSDDKFVMVWRSAGQDGSGYGVYGQIYDVNGRPYSQEFQVNRYIDSNQVEPTIAALDDDKFIVVWMSNGQDGSGYGIYAQIYDANGKVCGSEFLVNTYTEGDQGHYGYGLAPVTSLTNGRFLITWASASQDGSDFGVYGQIFSLEGNKIGSEFLVNTKTEFSQETPNVVSLADGKFVISWSSLNQDSSSWGVYGQIYHSDGSRYGSEFQINACTNGWQKYPSMASLSSGGFVIVWESGSNQDGSGYGVYGQIFNESGELVGSEFLINTYTYQFQHTPFVSSLENGDFIVVWMSQDQDGSDFGIYGQIFNVDGRKRGNEFLVNTYTTGLQSRPTANSFKDGKYIVAWESMDQDGSDYGIYAKILSPNKNYVFDPLSFGTPTITSFSPDDKIYFGTTELTGTALPITNEPGKYFLKLSDQLYFLTRNGEDLEITGAGNESDKLTIQKFEQGNFGLNTTDISAAYYYFYELPSLGAQTISGLDAASDEIYINEQLLQGTAWPVAGEPGHYVIPAKAGIQEQDCFLARNGTDLIITFTESETDSITIENFVNGQFGIGLIGEEFRINGVMTGDQAKPSVTRLSNGHFVVSYETEVNGSKEIYGRIYESNGVPVTAEILLTPNPGEKSQAVIKALGEGRFIIVWQETDEIGVKSNIKGQIFDETGATLGCELAIEEVDGGIDEKPAMTWLASTDGKTREIIVAWQSKYRDKDGWGIYAQRFNEDGTKLGEKFRVNTATTGDQTQVSLTSLSEEQFVAVWETESELSGKVIATDGSDVSSEFQINTITTGTQSHPQVTKIDSDRFLVVWQSNHESGEGYNIYARLYDSAGTALGSTFKVNNVTAANQTTPVIKTLVDGGFIIGWQSEEEDGLGLGIYAQVYDSEGTKISEPFRANTFTESDQKNVAVATLDDGKFVLVWQSQGQDADGWGVYAKILTTPPLIKKPIPDKEVIVGKAFSLELNPQEFFDEPENRTLAITDITLADGSSLPLWMSTAVNATTNIWTLSGFPLKETLGDTLSLEVTASDGVLTTKDTFDLSVINRAPIVFPLFLKTLNTKGYDNGYSVQQTSDDGFIVTGWTHYFYPSVNDLLVAKLEADGSLEWGKVVNVDGNHDEGNAVQQTSDGGFIVVGNTFRSNWDMLLTKFGPDGSLIWSKAIGGSGAEGLYSIQQTDDSHFIILGHSSSFSVYPNVFLAKIDNDGNLIWSKSIGDGGSSYGRSVQKISDGGLVVTGWIENIGSGGFDILLAKLDINGNLVWCKTIGGSGNNYGYFVQQLEDGGFVVAGRTDGFGAGLDDLILVKFDSDGGLIWSKAIGGSDKDYGYSVQQTQDGGFVVTGYTESYGAGARDLLLAKFQSNGNLVWCKTIGGEYDDSGYSVQEASDKGFIITGMSKSFGTGNSELLLVKLSSQGELESGTALVQDITPIIQTITPTIQTITPTVAAVTPTVTNLAASLTIEDIPQSALTTIYDNGLKDQIVKVGVPFSYQFTDGLFVDPDGHFLTYNATGINGTALSDWLSFNATIRTFNGIPIKEYLGITAVGITAEDGYGGIVSDRVKFAIEPSLTVLYGNQTGIYTEDTPYDFRNIMIYTPSETVDAAMTLSDSGVGELTTATSGSVTSIFNATIGEWLASGNVTAVIDLLAGLRFIPLIDGHGNFTIAVKIVDQMNYPYMDTIKMIGSPVNDPPIISDFVKSVDEDHALTFAASEFIAHYSDVEGSELTKIQIVSLPAHGALELSGDPVTLNQEIAVNDLDHLTFVPDADWNGTTTVEWKGHDGTEYSIAAATVTMTINAVNDAPVVSDFVKSVDEDHTLTFAASEFIAHYSDVEGSELTKIQIVSLPGHGTLELSGEPVTLNQEIAVNDLDHLTFEPDADWNGTTTVEWKGHDGTDYSIAAATVAMTINAVNDAPVVSDFVKSVDEDHTLTFAASEFIAHYSDVEGSELTKIQIVSLPDHGTLELSGEPVTLNQEIAVSDLDHLTFVPDTDWNGTTTVEWKGHDGTDYSIAAATVTMTINAVNDAPVVSDFVKSMDEDHTLTFAASEFIAHYSDVEGSELTKIQIVSLPDHGTLELSGDPVTLNQEIAVNDLDHLTFVPDADWNGTTTVEWKGHDGTEYSNNISTVSITVHPVEDAPVVSDFTKSADEDHLLIFSSADFELNYSDVEGDPLILIKILSLPQHGELQLNGMPVMIGQLIDRNDLNTLVFRPNDDWYGTTTFNWLGFDGTDYSVTSATVTINIIGVNDAPILIGRIREQSDVPKVLIADEPFNFSFCPATVFYDKDDAYHISIELADGSPLPEWLHFDAESYTFFGTPTADDCGYYEIRVIDSDSEYEVFDLFTVTVGKKPQGEFVVNTYSADDQSYPAIIQLPSKEFVVVWQSNLQDADKNGIYGQMYSKEGIKINLEFQVNEVTAGDQRMPLVAAFHHENKFIVLWTSVAETDSATTIKGRIFNEYSEPVVPAFEIYSQSAAEVTYAAITMLSDDSFIVLWSAADSGKYNLFGQRYDKTGSVIGGSFELTSQKEDQPIMPAVIALENDDFVVAWEQFTSARGNVYAHIYDKEGNPVGKEMIQKMPLTETGTGIRQKPALTLLPEDNFVLSWHSLGQTGRKIGVYTQRYDNEGSPISKDMLERTYGYQVQTSLVSLPEGYYAVIWHDADPKKDGLEIFGQIFNAEGEREGKRFQVNEITTKDQTQPVMMLLNQGSYMVCWQSQTQDGDGNAIVARILYLQPLLLYPIQEQSPPLVSLNVPYSFTFRADTFKNIDPDTVVYEAKLAGDKPLPLWLSFDSATRTFSGTPTEADLGELTIILTAYNGIYTVEDQFSLTIKQSLSVTHLDNPILYRTDYPFAQIQIDSMVSSEVTVILMLSDTTLGQLTTPNYQTAVSTFNSATGRWQVSGEVADVNYLLTQLEFERYDAATRSDFSVSITVDDGINLPLEQELVMLGNRAPELILPIDRQVSKVAQYFSLNLKQYFSDPDLQDSFELIVQQEDGSPASAWLNYDAETGILSGIPDKTAQGTMKLKVIADDDVKQSETTLEMDVLSSLTATNTTISSAYTEGQSLTLGPIEITSEVSDTATVFFNLSDPKAGRLLMDTSHDVTITEDTLTGVYQISGEISEINAVLTEFTFMPNELYCKDLLINVVVDDNINNPISGTLSLPGIQVNHAPFVVSRIGSRETTVRILFYLETQPYFDDLDLYDGRGDRLRYEAELADGSSWPSWLHLNSTTGVYEGYPTERDVGRYEIKEIVRDSAGASDTDTFVLEVKQVKPQPSSGENGDDGNIWLWIGIAGGCIALIAVGGVCYWRYRASKDNPLKQWKKEMETGEGKAVRPVSSKTDGSLNPIATLVSSPKSPDAASRGSLPPLLHASAREIPKHSSFMRRGNLAPLTSAFFAGPEVTATPNPNVNPIASRSMLLKRTDHIPGRSIAVLSPGKESVNPMSRLSLKSKKDE